MNPGLKFLPSLEKYRKISNFLPSNFPYRSLIHSIQRRVSNRFDRPRQVKEKKKKEFNLPAVQIDQNKPERREEISSFSCEFQIHPR